LRRAWIFENLILDDEEEQQRIIANIELLATYVNPKFMREVFQHRGPAKEDTPDYGGHTPTHVIRLGGVEFVCVNDAFERRASELAQTGQTEPGPDNPRIPAIRAELRGRYEQSGREVPYWLQEHHDLDVDSDLGPDVVVVPDGSEDN